MENTLDKCTRSFIESEALKLQRSFVLRDEPNVYEYSSINDYFRRKKWRFEFNAKLKTAENSMNGTFLENSIEQMINYNVKKTEDRKVLQFDINHPNLQGNQYEYMMFLRAIFYELWSEIKENSEYKGVEFFDNADYSLFSRSMIVPYKKFKNAVREYSKDSDNYKIFEIADIFSVLYGVIEDRIVDCGCIE